jgi:hypothetical protein
LASEIGATPVPLAEAAADVQILILAVPVKAIVTLPIGLLEKLGERAIVIDIGNYFPGIRDGRIEAIEEGKVDSLWVAGQIGRPVIKAFNNIVAKSLAEKGRPRGSPNRIALSVYGDLPEAKAVVLRLVDDLGFDPVDGGGLADSWRQQPGTPAYCRDLGADELRRALAQADRDRIAEYRTEREVMFKARAEAQTAS